jgi:hypothetical protein
MYFPPIPTRIFLSGDISKAQGYITLGRKVLFELKRDSTWDAWNTVPTGQREIVLADKTKIRVAINYGLSSIDIEVPLKGHKGHKKACECCTDCLLIGIITSVTTTVNDTRIADIEMCQTGTTYLAFENIPLIDANPNLKPSDRVIVYATPVLKQSGDLTYGTNLRTVNDFRPGKVWQFYNCMQSDNAGDIVNDLTSVGIGNQEYTISGDSCSRAGKAIITDPEEVPPIGWPLRFFITSIKAGECLTL